MSNAVPTRETLCSKLTELEARIDTLEAENERLKSQLDEQHATLTATRAQTEALSKRTQTNKSRIEELQARELEKGAHLLSDTVDTTTIDVANDRLEKLTKDDGRPYFRLPDHEDPLDRSQRVALAHGDLLPIQQLARLDGDMLRSTTNALPTRLAARLWKARVDPTVGDSP